MEMPVDTVERLCGGMVRVSSDARVKLTEEGVGGSGMVAEGRCLVITTE